MFEQEIRKGLGTLDLVLEGFTAFLANQGIGVLTLREEKKADFLLTGGKGQADLKGFPGKLNWQCFHLSLHPIGWNAPPLLYRHNSLQRKKEI